MLLPTLIEFMLDQGPSKNNNLQEWDKIWAINKSHLEPMAGKYTAVSKERLSIVKVSNLPDTLIMESVAIHPKTKELGDRPLFKKNQFYIEYDDANLIKEGEKITFMKWGNFNITKKTVREDGSFLLDGEYLAEDKDFKTTQKITWLAADDSILTHVRFIELSHLITTQKLDDSMKIEDYVNPNSKMITEGWADPTIKDLVIGDFVQFERRGFYRCDKKFINKDGKLVVDMIFVPDGKSKGMSNISSKVDAHDMSKGISHKPNAEVKKAPVEQVKPTVEEVKPIVEEVKPTVEEVKEVVEEKQE